MSTIHDIVWIMNYKFLLKNYTCWINFSFFLCFKFFLDLGSDEKFKHIKNWKWNGNLEIYVFYNIKTKKYLLVWKLYTVFPNKNMMVVLCIQIF